MQKGALCYEGKAKKLYTTDDPQLLWVAYKDEATAFNGEKHAILQGKARLNNEISSMIFTTLAEKGCPSHFVRKLSATEQLVKRVTIIPLEVIVRNKVAGSLAHRLGLKEGMQLAEPLVEFCYKDDSLGDPLVTEDHIAILAAASQAEVARMKEQALRVNELLSSLFARLGVILVDFKLEFGKTETGALLLADEISPDTCRLWDEKTGARLDKDLFRHELGNLQEGYEEILARLSTSSS
ncbi:phosphoribosylaminoimidazolesuccinocarboxamide synthase [Shouchella lonarensis]|uniref:Phosphoribosylaminoimidazole-succinocarboxamide synthase n=1 Tax=Shouchella lonarensis TaxID=1464122 RepID=A0A1G6MPH3_9BACI|nr:phosphoribosylaminoimidazolesuccinocarboxamide synthase [Shouchella lonarensis]SDC57127.1 phosphoribosylaminoimidazole-succinocarboxamide synthase [Shouchella lonarensis]